VRSIAAVRATVLACLLLGLLAVGASPALALSSELAPSRTPRPARAAGGRAHAAAKGPTVTAALQGLLRTGAITQATYSQDYAGYVAAKRSLSRLSGTRAAELGAVLTNVQQIAAAGALTGSLQASVFLTLEENRRWWTTEPLLSGRERVKFAPSELVWEYYPGQGIQIQWLATFGEGNGYYLSGHENGNLKTLLGEIIPLASEVGSGIAWEYLFHFDGGAPPWTSGLSQGTGLQLLARGYQRLKSAEYLTAAQQALGIFQIPPPRGVRVPNRLGTLYAEYSYAPSDRILNGFIQALVGIYDYTAITKDPVGLSLFEAGDAEARAIVSSYDTGSWSLYDQYGESDLNYHELLTEFLQHLCERTRKGPPIATTAPATSSPEAAGGTSGTGTSTGASPGGVSATSAQVSTQIPGDEIYCTTAQKFTADLHTPPVVSLLTTHLRGGTRAGVQISLSKISTVSMTVRKGSSVLWRNSATIEGGKPRLLWVTPAAGGTFTVSFTATDLAGNFSTTSGTIVVARH
jgi:hypothetical protein